MIIQSLPILRQMKRALRCYKVMLEIKIITNPDTLINGSEIMEKELVVVKSLISDIDFEIQKLSQ